MIRRALTIPCQYCGGVLVSFEGEDVGYCFNKCKNRDDYLRCCVCGGDNLKRYGLVECKDCGNTMRCWEEGVPF